MNEACGGDPKSIRMGIWQEVRGIGVGVGAIRIGMGETSGYRRNTCALDGVYGAQGAYGGLGDVRRGILATRGQMRHVGARNGA